MWPCWSVGTRILAVKSSESLGGFPARHVRLPKGIRRRYRYLSWWLDVYGSNISPKKCWCRFTRRFLDTRNLSSSRLVNTYKYINELYNYNIILHNIYITYIIHYIMHNNICIYVCVCMCVCKYFCWWNNTISNYPSLPSQGFSQCPVAAAFVPEVIWGGL